MRLRTPSLPALLSIAGAVLIGPSFMASANQGGADATSTAGDAPGAPQVEISNGLIHAKLYLPDTGKGYYRGSRFDWSGVIASLAYENHNYFGKWFPHYDPRLHDAITGPVEEFRTEEGGIGYNDAKPGGTFIKIGVGVLRRLDDGPYAFTKPYEIVNPGKWTVRTGKDSVQFTQELKDSASGYAYVYRKTVRLAKGKPDLILEHTLKNTGSKPIETSVYDHDFYVIDGKPTGPDVTVRFGFTPKAAGDFNNLAEIQGNQLVYHRELQEHETAAAYINGFGISSNDNDITVENKATGAGVKQTGDRPLSKLYLWSIRTTVCPEAYISLKVDPKEDTRYRINYHFYTLDNSKTK